MKRIALISLNVVLMTFVYESLCNAQDTDYESKYACVPVAASIALRYFNIPHEYRDIYEEVNVQENTGYASLGDLIRVCEKRGLFCKAYRGFSLKQVKKYLSNGCIIVVYINNNNYQHAVSLLEINGRIAAYDVIKPLHYVNIERFERFLSKKVLCVAIKDQPISTFYSINSRVFGMSLVAILIIGVFFTLIKKNRKEKEMFKKINFKRTALLSFAVCLVLFFLSLSSAISLEELDKYSAACEEDECCNQTGGSPCSGVGSPECAYKALDCGLILCDGSYYNWGLMCDETGHDYAPSGSDNADCDNGYLDPGQQTCWILTEKIFCSGYKTLSCSTDYTTIIKPPPGPNERKYYCDNSESDKGTYNNSRERCSGTGGECWW